VTVEDGVYPVYLLSRGCERLYLSIAQGCTALYNSLGKRMANAELRRRAGLLRPLVLEEAHRLTAAEMALLSKSWRGPLYEAGSIVAVKYATDRLPSEAQLIADLQEAIALYRVAAPAASWGEITAVLEQAREEHGFSSFDEAKRYGFHRRIERKSNIPKEVKKALGFVCMGCETNLAHRYGPAAEGLIEAHHLKPLSELHEGTVRKLTKADFAVLCPNCHRVIHRMPDPSDITALRTLLHS
jgi:5-methylcytosine-specific restriction protein A